METKRFDMTDTLGQKELQDKISRRRRTFCAAAASWLSLRRRCTVWGPTAWTAEAVRHIFEAKGRPQDNPLILHVPEASVAGPVLPRMCRRLAYALAERFWPGPLTMILQRRERGARRHHCGTGHRGRPVPQTTR